MSFQELLDKIATLDLSQVSEPRRPPSELIGFFVRVCRGQRNWKIETLANFAGVSKSTIERIERGEKVSDDCLKSIAEALGYERDYLTSPRLPKSRDEAISEFVEKYGELQPVPVKPLRHPGQVRALAQCHAYLTHRPNLGAEYDERIQELVEWLDLAAFILNPFTEDKRQEARRRELYSDVLDCVRRLEASGTTVLAGSVSVPIKGIPDWKIAILSITSKQSDPGAIKRRFIFVDRRVLHAEPNWDLAA